MTSRPLSSQEWKVLHRAMDRVGHQPWHPVGPDAEKIRAVARATYASQGIEVSEVALTQAVDEALREFQQLPAAQAVSHRAPQSWLWRLSQYVGAVAANENLLGHRPKPVAQNFPAFFPSIKRWERLVEPYVRHTPLSDAQIAERLNGAVRFQMGRWKSCGPVAVGLFASALLVLGLGAWASYAWDTAWGFYVGAGTSGFLSYQSFLWTMRRIDAQAKLARLGRALGALAHKHWDEPALKASLAGTGWLVRGSLSPLPTADAKWQSLKRRSQPVEDLRTRWATWDKSEHLRESDREVFAKMAHLMDSHPTRVMLRGVIEKVRSRIGPLRGPHPKG